MVTYLALCFPNFWQTCIFSQSVRSCQSKIPYSSYFYLFRSGFFHLVISFFLSFHGFKVHFFITPNNILLSGHTIIHLLFIYREISQFYLNFGNKRKAVNIFCINAMKHIAGWHNMSVLMHYFIFITVVSEKSSCFTSLSLCKICIMDFDHPSHCVYVFNICNGAVDEKSCVFPWIQRYNKDLEAYNLEDFFFCLIIFQT